MKQSRDAIIKTGSEESPLLWILLAIGLPTLIPGALALIMQL